MRRLITGTIILLFCALNLIAQYVNTDSLIFIPGFEEPVMLSAFDSLLLNSPETDLHDIHTFIYGHNFPAGRLLGQFTLPANGNVISRFGPRAGRMHSGTDIKMNRGDTVFAVFDGAVSQACYWYGYGNMVVLNHGSNLTTSYSHLSGFLVKTGEKIKKGQPVGLAGNTGRASTNHLHFEIREGGRAFDPELVFDFENAKIRDEVPEIYNLTELYQTLNPVAYSVNEPTPQKYIVKNGDSLWKISRRFRTSINALCLLNDLNENSVLRVGMVLKLF